MYLGKLCEVAPSDELYRAPMHPYTNVLLASIPVPDPEVDRSQVGGRRRAAVAGAAAAGVPLPPALPERHRGVHDHRAGAARAGGGALRRLPPPGDGVPGRRRHPANSDSGRARLTPPIWARIVSGRGSSRIPRRRAPRYGSRPDRGGVRSGHDPDRTVRADRTRLDSADLRRRRARRDEPGARRRHARRASPAGASTTSTPPPAYGASEDRLQPWLAEHRHDVFLATKTGERRGDAARAELERSLQRMGVDHVDLDPAAQPRRARRVGRRPRARRRRRGARPRSRRGARALHRRHRPRPAHRRDAPALARALPVRHRAVPVQPLAACRARVPGRRRGARRALRRRRRGAADDQVDRPPPLGRATPPGHGSPGTSR